MQEEEEEEEGEVCLQNSSELDKSHISMGLQLHIRKILYHPVAYLHHTDCTDQDHTLSQPENMDSVSCYKIQSYTDNQETCSDSPNCNSSTSHKSF